MIGLVTGGAVSAAAVTTFQSKPGEEIPAPPGVIPGSPIISLLGESNTTEVTGSGVLDLPPVPNGATHVRVSFTCLTPATFKWGTDPTGNNPSVSCSPSDIGSSSSSSWYDFTLADGRAAFYIEGNADARAVITFQYVNYVPTALGVNEHGETFGTSGGGLSPDLISVYGTAKDGEQILGYARSEDLDAAGPDGQDQPSNPDEALALQDEINARYPDGWDIPVYLSDGRTVIGTFHIGG